MDSIKERTTVVGKELPMQPAPYRLAELRESFLRDSAAAGVPAAPANKSGDAPRPSRPPLMDGISF